MEETDSKHFPQEETETEHKTEQVDSKDRSPPKRKTVYNGDFSQGYPNHKYGPPRRPYFDEDVEWNQRRRGHAPEIHGLATNFEKQRALIKKSKFRDAAEQRMRKRGLVPRKSPYKTLQWVEKQKDTKAERFGSKKFNFASGFAIDDKTGPVSSHSR